MKPTHILIQYDDGTIRESKGAEAATALAAALGASQIDHLTFELRAADAAYQEQVKAAMARV